MARCCLIGWFIANESKAVMMVDPAEGPSLGVAPSGTCKWIELVSKKLVFKSCFKRKACERKRASN